MSRKPVYEALEIKIRELEARLNAVSENAEKNRHGRGELQAIIDLLPSIGRIARDITDRRRAEEDVRDVKEMLQLVMDNIPQFIFWKNRDLVYLGCNRNFARVAGVDEPEAIVGKTDYDLAWKKEEAAFFRQCDRRVMGTDTPEYHVLEPQFQADGRQAWLDTNKIPLHDDEGQVVGILEPTKILLIAKGPRRR